MKEKIEALLHELKEVEKMASNLEDEIRGNHMEAEADAIGAVKLTLDDLVTELEKLN